MDEAFDQMIRDRMEDALKHALKRQALGPLPLPQETLRQHLQVQLGNFLITLGQRLRHSGSPASHSTTW
jgi:hypothetical protein